jgi:hypothetical protein
MNGSSASDILNLVLRSSLPRSFHSLQILHPYLGLIVTNRELCLWSSFFLGLRDVKVPFRYGYRYPNHFRHPQISYKL